MRKQGIRAAAAILAASLGALGAAAQGPAGVGGDQSPRNSSASANSGTSHSPSLKSWLKREDKATTSDDKPTTAKVKDAKTTSTESTRARHSLNPVHWVKKDKKAQSDDKPKAAKVKTVKTTSAESSHTHHSLNPVRWIKKAPDQAAQKSDKAKSKKSSTKPVPVPQETSAPTPAA